MAKEKKPNEALRYERVNRGWSQQFLADKLETTDKVVSDWERGIKMPGKEHQRGMCELFGKTAEELGFIPKREGKASSSLVLANPSCAPEQKGVLSAATVLWLITTHASAVQTLIQQLQNEPQSSHTPFVVESAPDLVDPSPQKEEAIPSPDVHMGGTMEDDQDSGGEDMNKGRRTTTHGIVLAGTTALTGHQNFIADVQRVLRQPSLGPGDKELGYLEQKIRDYWQVRYNATFALVDLLLYAETYVQGVKTLLNRSLLPSIRTRLCACLSQGMLLRGACFYDLGQFQTARACYQTALEAAHEASNPILQAQAWYWDSYSWLYSHEPNRYQHALGSMLKACHFASLASDLAVQGVTLAGSAEVYGYLKDKTACLKVLKRVSSLSGYGHGDYYHLHQFDDTRSLNGYRGCCLQQFDQPSDPDSHALLEEAGQAIQETLSQLGAVSLQRAYYVADMAQLRARKGEVESACDHARQIIPFAVPSAAVRHTLATVRALLEPYADAAAVRDLDREIVVVLLQVQQ